MIIEDEELNDIFKMLYSKVQVPCSNTLAMDIKEVHSLMKVKFIALLQVSTMILSHLFPIFTFMFLLLQKHEGAIHIALDAWSSKKASSYLGLTIQWCPDNADNIIRATLDLVRVRQSHTGEYLAGTVYQILDEFGILQKVCIYLLFFTYSYSFGILAVRTCG
jgi:hypothetical protein